LPQLFEAAALSFDFSGARISQLMQFVKSELDQITLTTSS
jgi:hypothetical protein